VNEKKSSFWKKVTVAVAAFFLLTLLMSTIFGKKGLIVIVRARKVQAELQKEIESLKAEKARLERELAALKSKPESVDREAREKLWLMKPEEKVIIKKSK
jgi:cell division protein FtsB